MFRKFHEAINEIESIGLGSAYNPYSEYQRRTTPAFRFPSIRRILTYPIRRYQEVRARRRL